MRAISISTGAALALAELALFLIGPLELAESACGATQRHRGKDTPRLNVPLACNNVRRRCKRHTLKYWTSLRDGDDAICSSLAMSFGLVVAAAFPEWAVAVDFSPTQPPRAATSESATQQAHLRDAAGTTSLVHR